jgi:serine/threonine protein kinase/tetratricopeptide (TPR) repeat protein
MPTSLTIEQLFAEALNRPAGAERDAYLDAACGDPELRGRVERLLRAHGDAESFLESPVVALDASPTTDYPSPERPGTQIGPYKLLQQIGEGGFGIVFMAEQTEPVRRRVAIKVIKPGMDTRQVIARFEAERQALAVMDHPNIARVLDAGATETGRPYFVMELVRGTPITQYCDENSLSIRDRLTLFASVCQAIQHAHTKGIIHRDIKPTNVLVTRQDGQAVVKVIDFGIAKAMGQQLTEKTLFTNFAQMIGTPLYMSPEQAELSGTDIDTRSDIYSLGVLLYELLTGSTPVSKQQLKRAAFDEIRRIIREDEAQRPSNRISTSEAAPSIAAQRHTEPAKLTKLVRGELDWIVMKAIEKDRNRRYETANGFAADLQRYLADEPVQACPPSAVYRFRKFARRNRGRLAAAAILAAALLVAFSGIGWALRDRQAREAEIARQQSERQLRLTAQVNKNLAEADRLMSEQKWPEALAATRRAEAAVAGGEAGAATVEQVRQYLKDVQFVDRLEQIRLERATWVEGKPDNAGADEDYSRAFREHGVDTEALTLGAAIDRLRTRSELAIPLAAALDDWVDARRKAFPTDDRWKRLVSIARGVDPEPMRDRLRSIWGQTASQSEGDLRRMAETIDVRAQHPATLVTLARSLKRGKPSDTALRILREAQHVYPGDFYLNFECGNALLDKGDFDGAIRFCAAAVAIRPNSPVAHNNLGIALQRQKKPVRDEAIRCYRKAIELEPRFARSYENLSRALAGQDKFEDAVALLLNAIELYPDHADSLDTSAWSLGEIAWDLATHADPARRDQNRALKLAEETVQRVPHSHMAWQYLGWIYYRMGNWNSSIEALEKSCKLQPGNEGDAGQWIVLALAHAKLSSQADVPAKEREHHNAQARRRYEAADKQIVSWWRRRPDYKPGQGIWDFRAEAQELMGPSDASQAAALLESGREKGNESPTSNEP